MTARVLGAPRPVLLENHVVRLEPLEPRHEKELRAWANDPVVWAYGPGSADDGAADGYAAWFAKWWQGACRQHASGAEVAFAVRRQSDGQVVGSTRFMNASAEHRRVEVGHTRYAATARGTAVNPACKVLLLGHAFETLGLVRVELKCDARNVASRRAIAKMGAREEGTLRRHMILGDGHIRDTVYFSVLDTEWPAVKATLERRISAHASGPAPPAA